MKNSTIWVDMSAVLVLACVCIVPISLLIVDQQLVFPFVVSKVLFFRTIVLIGFSIHVLRWADGQYQLTPTHKQILLLFSLYIVVVQISNTLGVNPPRSFWSGFERMEGMLGLLFEFAYLAILLPALNSMKAQRIFLSSLVLVISLLALIGLAEQKMEMQSLLGNPNYFAEAMLFGLLCLAYLATLFDGRWFCLLIMPVVGLLLIYCLFQSDSRAAIYTLYAVSMVILIAIPIRKYARVITRKRLLILSLLLIGLSMLLIVVFTEWLSVSKLVSNDRTLAYRLEIWKIALEAIRQNFWLGAGQESFEQLYLVHYQPGILDQARPWFDRVHNILLDVMLSNGVVGLSVLLFLCYRLIDMIKNNYALSQLQKLIVFAFFMAYLIKNLVGFNTLTSQIFLFVFVSLGVNSPVLIRTHDGASPRRIWLLSLIFPVLLLAGYQAVYRPYMSARALYHGLFFSGLVAKGLTVFHCSQTPQPSRIKPYCKSLEGETLEPDSAYLPVYTAIKRSIAYGQPYQADIFWLIYDDKPLFENHPNSVVSKNFALLYLRLIEQMRNSLSSKSDYYIARYWLERGQFDQALQSLQSALDQVPNKPLFWLTEAKLYMYKGDYAKSSQALRRLETLNSDYPDTARVKQRLVKLRASVANAGLENDTQAQPYPGIATLFLLLN